MTKIDDNSFDWKFKKIDEDYWDEYYKKSGLQESLGNWDWTHLPIEQLPIKDTIKANDSSQDPNSTGFKKFDNGKPDLSLCPPLLLEMYVDASALGVEKYGRNNWYLAGPEVGVRYLGAALRHLTGYTDKEGRPRGFMNGEYIDAESGRSNLSHVLWCMAAMEFLIRKYGIEEVRKYL